MTPDEPQATSDSIAATKSAFTHRLSTVSHVHRIRVLDRGRVGGAGTHDELVVQDGDYARLWRVQTGEPTPV
jgi:ATP-binding cassette subfamily B protein